MNVPKNADRTSRCRALEAGGGRRETGERKQNNKTRIDEHNRPHGLALKAVRTFQTCLPERGRRWECRPGGVEKQENLNVHHCIISIIHDLDLMVLITKAVAKHKMMEVEVAKRGGQKKEGNHPDNPLKPHCSSKFRCHVCPPNMNSPVRPDARFWGTRFQFYCMLSTHSLAVTTQDTTHHRQARKKARTNATCQWCP